MADPLLEQIRYVCSLQQLRVYCANRPRPCRCLIDGELVSLCAAGLLWPLL